MTSLQKDKIHILIVDDVYENIQVLANILSKENYEINVATGGNQAVDIIPQLLPDLILLDINMPVLNGFEVCKLVKANDQTKEIPIIFVTAKTDHDSIMEGFELGAADYVTKPFDVSELIARVRVHSELKRSKEIILFQNQELAEKNQTLKDLVATRDKMYSIIAHDLKSPFNGIIGLSEILKNDIDHFEIQKIKSFIDKIYLTSKNAFLLLESLLKWTRTQTGQINFNLDSIDLNLIIQLILRSLGSAANSKNITLIYDPVQISFVMADMNMIETVIRNLISNSIKFTNLGGEIQIKVTQTNVQTEIIIQDNGVGIKSEILQGLFKIGIMKSEIGTLGEVGTGLGLLICKEFIDKHKGKLEVESEFGEGTKFIVTLPNK